MMAEVRSHTISLDFIFFSAFRSTAQPPSQARQVRALPACLNLMCLAFLTGDPLSQHQHHVQ